MFDKPELILRLECAVAMARMCRRMTHFRTRPAAAAQVTHGIGLSRRIDQKGSGCPEGISIWQAMN